MAADPRQENLFTRRGTFSEYDSLRLYYAALAATVIQPHVFGNIGATVSVPC